MQGVSTAYTLDVRTIVQTYVHTILHLTLPYPTFLHTIDEHGSIHKVMALQNLKVPNFGSQTVWRFTNQTNSQTHHEPHYMANMPTHTHVHISSWIPICLYYIYKCVLPRFVDGSIYLHYLHLFNWEIIEGSQLARTK